MSGAERPSWHAVALAEAEKAFRLEIESSALLSSKAEKYVAAGALAVGLPMLGPLSDMALAKLPSVDRALLLMAGSLFAIGITLALLALSTRRYKSYPPGRQMLEVLEQAANGEIGVYLQMAGIYLDARASNRKVNMRRSTLLGWSSITLVIGFGSILIFQVIRFIA